MKNKLFKNFKFTISKGATSSLDEYEFHSNLFWNMCDSLDGNQEDIYVGCLRQLESIMYYSAQMLTKKERIKLQKTLKQIAKTLKNAKSSK